MRERYNRSIINNLQAYTYKEFFPDEIQKVRAVPKDAGQVNTMN